MEEDQVITALGALAQDTRLRILRFLVTKGSEGAMAGEISAAVGASSSRASFHLSCLADAGLLVSTRKSRSIIYRVSFETMGELMRYLLHDCCKNHKTVAGCC